MLPLIILATLIGGLSATLIAALLLMRLRQTQIPRLIAFAAGAMLAAALLDILPEAFESAQGGQSKALFATLLAGIVAFFLLERLTLWRHGSFSAAGIPGAVAAPGVAWTVLIGDGVHNFFDGVLIAAAFLADPWLGVTATVAVVAHEIPQEIGDLGLLLASGWSWKKALLANGISSLTAVAGGLAGWLTLDGARQLLPYGLVIAAASFLYIAIADLMPILHRRHREDGFGLQMLTMLVGLVSIPLVGHFVH